MATAAGHLAKVSLELGGKAPAIVWSDADLDNTVKAIVAASSHRTVVRCARAPSAYTFIEEFHAGRLRRSLCHGGSRTPQLGVPSRMWTSVRS